MEWNGIDTRPPIKVDIVEKLKERWEPPKIFENAISDDEIKYLRKLNADAVNPVETYVNGNYRRLVADRSEAYEFLKHHIERVCTYPHKFTNAQFTGNFFRTRTPYTLHADTGCDPDLKPGRIVVFPLNIVVKEDCEYIEEYNRFSIMDQQWYGQAASFVKGNYDIVKNNGHSYMKPIVEYSTNMHNIADTPFDKDRFEDAFGHLRYEYFDGLSERACVSWRPGDIMTFDRCDIHTPTNFLKANVIEKEAVTFFLEYADL